MAASQNCDHNARRSLRTHPFAHREILRCGRLVRGVAIALLLLVAPAAARLAASGRADADGNDIVEMERMEITADRYRWSYARVGDFEILSGLDNDRMAAGIVQNALQIIDVFGANSPLFRMRSELPTKIILIKDPSIERFITAVDARAGAEIKRDARVKDRSLKRPDIQGMGEGSYAPERSIKCLTRLDDEQAQIVMYIPAKYKWRANDYYSSGLLANACFRLCRISNGISSSNLTYTFSNAKILSIDSSERDVIKRDESELLSAGTTWYALNRDDLLIRRFDYKRERIIFQSLSKPGRRVLSQFLNAPKLDLGDVLEYPETFRIKYGGANTAPDVDNYITYKRQISDFSIYCVFSPDEQVREGYYTLLRAVEKRPLNEALFKQCMGRGYAAFHDEIYAHFRKLGSDGHTGAANNWGAARFTAPFPAGKPAPAPKFRDAERSERARMFAEWYWSCNAPHLARETFAKAEKQVPAVLWNPEFAAALGLFEARTRNKTKALELLNKAALLETTRPAAHRALAQLRCLDIRAGKKPGETFSANDIGRVIEPVRAALDNPRHDTKTCITLIRAWRSIDAKPSGETFRAITAACLKNPGNFTLIPSAVALLRTHGLEDDVSAILTETAKCALSESEAALLKKMRDGYLPPLPSAWKNADGITE